MDTLTQEAARKGASGRDTAFVAAVGEGNRGNDGGVGVHIAVEVADHTAGPMSGGADIGRIGIVGDADAVTLTHGATHTVAA